MSTSMLTAVQELSVELGDYFSSALTSNGGASGDTIIDTALSGQNAGTINANRAWVMVTSGTYDEQIREASSLSASTLTMSRNFGGQILSAVTYDLHRIWSPEDKRDALRWAARNLYPSLHKKILNETRVTGNWLRNGDMEVWTNGASSAPDYWNASASVAQESTAGNVYKGTYSAKLTATGTLAQREDDNIILRELSGKSVTFKVAGKLTATDTMRIYITSNSTTTYSDYAAGGNAWDNEETTDRKLKVTATIDDNPVAIEFHVAGGNLTYIDDARVIGPAYDWVYIGDLGFKDNRPDRVYYELYPHERQEHWMPIKGWKVNKDGWMKMESGSYVNDRRMRIEGRAHLDFLTSAGVASNAWDNTIDIDAPYTDLLYAAAKVRLLELALTTPADRYTSTEQLSKALSGAQRNLNYVKARHSMYNPAVQIKYPGE